MMVGNRGFTLVETMVVVVIMMFLIGGGFVYLNKFNSRQKLEAAKDSLVSNLRLIRNNAVTVQKPKGMSDNLAYIKVILTSDGIMTALANGDVGTSYFSKKLTSDIFKISANPTNFLFSAYDGKLVKENLEGKIVPVDIGQTITIKVESAGDVSDFKTVIINTAGLVNEI